MQTKMPNDLEKFKAIHFSRARLGKKLYQARARAELKQSELAMILRVHQSQISAWEQGRKIPTEQTLQKYLNKSILSPKEYTILLNYQQRAISVGSASVKARALK